MAATPFHPGSSFRRHFLLLTGLGLLLAGLPGCQSIDVNSQNVSEVRFLNASSTSNGLDFYANNGGLAFNVGYPFITSYIPLPPGTYTLAANTPDTRQTLATINAGLSSHNQYTAIVSNDAATMQETVFLDQSVAAPTGQIDVRFIDEATHVGAIDVYLVPSKGKLETSSPVATNMTLGVNSGYLAIPAGTYSIAVVPAGTIPVSTTATLLTGGEVGYVAGDVRTVVLVDQQIATIPGVASVVANDYDPPAT